MLFFRSQNTFRNLTKLNQCVAAYQQKEFQVNLIINTHLLYKILVRANKYLIPLVIILQSLKIFMLKCINNF